MVGDVCKCCVERFTQGCNRCFELYKISAVNRLKEVIKTDNSIKYKYIINIEYAYEIGETLNKKGYDINILDYEIKNIGKDNIMIEVDKTYSEWQENLKKELQKINKNEI